jgi:hypothetical protein
MSPRAADSLKDTRYVKELARVRQPSASSPKSASAIERIFVKKSKQVEIRLSSWQGTRMMPKPLMLPEADLLPLLRDAIRGEVFSKEFLVGLRQALATGDAGVSESLAEDAPELLRVQAHFHALIRARAGDAVRAAGVTLPTLGAEAGTQDEPAWFPIDGMHGGFKYWWDPASKRLRLMAESWSRIVAGSGQLHEVTASGSHLLGEGFV